MADNRWTFTQYPGAETKQILKSILNQYRSSHQETQVLVEIIKLIQKQNHHKEWVCKLHYRLILQMSSWDHS